MPTPGYGGTRVTDTGCGGWTLPRHGRDLKDMTDGGHGGTETLSHGLAGMLSHGHGAGVMMTDGEHGVMKFGRSGTRTESLGSGGKIDPGLGGMRKRCDG